MDPCSYRRQTCRSRCGRPCPFGPLFTLSVEPIPSRSLGVEFLEEVLPFGPTGPLVIARYRLLTPVVVGERIPITAVEVDNLHTNPYVLLAPSVTPPGENPEIFDQLAVATNPPPQGSPPRSVIFNVALYRAVPVSQET